MAYEGSKSARDNFGKFIQQFQPETKTLIRKLERIVTKLYRKNVSLLFNETSIYIYIYVCVCVSVCVCVFQYSIIDIEHNLTLLQHLVLQLLIKWAYKNHKSIFEINIYIYIYIYACVCVCVCVCVCK